MKCRFLLDVVVGQSPAIFQLLASKDQPLLVWGNSLLILDLGLDIFNGVGGLHFQSDGLAGQGLDKDLHTTTQTKDQVESRLLLDVVVRQGASILQLLTSEDQPLLVWGDPLLILDLCLDIFNGVGGLHFQSDGLASQGLHKYLHATSETQDKMESGLLLDVVVRKSTAILKLLASKNQPLLVWWNAFLILDLSLDILDSVRWLHLESDSFASQGFDKNLHSTSQSKDQMKSRLLLDIVVRKGASILKLLASKDQPLLIWGNSLFVLDLGLDIFN